MAYRIEISAHVGRQMKKFSENVRKRIDAAVQKLADNPRPPGCTKLQTGENAWRIRIGEYRVIYEVHDKVLVVLVIRIDHRSIVYR